MENRSVEKHLDFLLGSSRPGIEMGKKMDNTINTQTQSKSEGHVMFLEKVEYFVRNNNLYRAPVHYPVQRDGYRCGRVEMPIHLAVEHLICLCEMLDI